MSRIDKLIDKLYKKPIPNDITYDEIEKIADHFGCIVSKKRGKHPLKIIHKESGTIIPIPKHGKCVQEAYIKQLKVLLDEIREVE